MDDTEQKEIRLLTEPALDIRAGEGSAGGAEREGGSEEEWVAAGKLNAE